MRRRCFGILEMNLIILHNGAEGCGELIDGADGNACPATRLDWGILLWVFLIFIYLDLYFYLIIR